MLDRLKQDQAGSNEVPGDVLDLRDAINSNDTFEENRLRIFFSEFTEWVLAYANVELGDG